MDVIKVINSKALEYFLIPAEEGFFFDHKETINIDLLNDKNCLFVFATNSNIAVISTLFNVFTFPSS